MAPLPHERTQDVLPFTFCGCDYFGPLFVYENIGKKTCKLKAYVLLFTDFTTRAIHCELVLGQDTERLIMALRRFISRRGCPTKIFSDNGTSFIRGDKDIKLWFDAIDWNKVQEHSLPHRISWVFQCPRAPWQGGHFESLVKSVKSALKRALKSSYVDAEQMHTVLAEAEATVNSRPLAAVCSSDADDPLPITPSLLAVNRNVVSIPTIPSSKSLPNTPFDAKKRYAHQRELARQFRKCFLKDYLLAQIPLRKWKEQVDLSHIIGKPVLIDDGTIKPGNKYPLGVVKGVHPGRDGLIRSADILVAC